MLSLEKEQRIRDSLETGLSGREIARLVGVSHWVVDGISHSASLIKELPESLCDEIRNLIFAGLPAGAIEQRLQVPKKTVMAVRRFFFLQRRKCDTNIPQKCPTCGAIIFPTKKHGARLTIPITISGNLRPKSISLLCDVVEDLLALDDLQLISNPLFYDLAQKTRKLTEGINDEQKQKARAA